MAAPVIIDVIVVLVLIVALVIGFQRGVIQPLMAEIFFFGTLLAVFRFHDQYTNEMQKLLHLNAVLSVFVALIIAVVLGAIGGAVGRIPPNGGDPGDRRIAGRVRAWRGDARR